MSVLDGCSYTKAAFLQHVAYQRQGHEAGDVGAEVCPQVRFQVSTPWKEAAWTTGYSVAATQEDHFCEWLFLAFS